MLVYKVPSSILGSLDRHDERFYNRVDMQISSELQNVAKDHPVMLGALLESIGTGKGIAKEEQGFGDISFLKVGNVVRYYLNYNNSEVVSDDVATRNKMQMLQQGDILISRVGTVGNVCMYNSEQKATPSDNILVLRLRRDDRVRPFYVTTFLNSPYGQAQIRRLAKQSLQEVINQTNIKLIVVPLPETNIQDKVCEQVNAHLSHIRELQAQAINEVDLAAKVFGLALSLGDGSAYKDLSVGELILASRDLCAVAIKNGQKYGATPDLQLEFKKMEKTSRRNLG